MTPLFVAGAGTGIGKTYVAAALVRALRRSGRGVLALKPLASGVPPLDDPAFAESDTARLLAAQGRPVTVDEVDACSPWRFAAPLAPDVAARAEGRRVSLQAVAAWCRDRAAAAPADVQVVVEGVGGVMSPVAQDATGLDWLCALGWPAILVCGGYLGAISHALTAEAAMQARGASVRARVANEGDGAEAPFEDTLDALRRFSPTPVIPLRRHTALSTAMLQALAPP